MRYALIDLDEVLYDMLTPLDETAKKMGFPLVNPSSYCLKIRYEGMDRGNDKKNLLEIFAEQGAYNKMTPFPGTIEGMETLRKYGITPLIVTARDFHPQAKKDTYEAVRRDFGIKKEHVIVDSKKIPHAIEWGVEFVYEDSLDNTVKILKELPLAMGFLIEADYNQSPEKHSRIKRVKNFQEGVQKSIPHFL